MVNDAGYIVHCDYEGYARCKHMILRKEMSHARGKFNSKGKDVLTTIFL